MDKFPTEILNSIFKHLHQTERIECMLVCRHWAHSIRMTCLLNTVSIIAEDYDPDPAIIRFESLTETLQQNPNLSDQVQHALLRDCFDDDFDGSVLGTQFPRLRFLFLGNTYIGQDQFTPTQLERFKSWQKYLVQVIENETALFTFSFLEAGIFDCLTTICLEPDQESLPAPTQERYLKSLKNAPLLTTLKLNGFAFPLKYLELIHENAPRLRSLALGRVSLHDKGENLPEAISPADNMKELCIYDSIVSIDMQYRWIRYISQKYKNLLEFTFECDIDDGDNENELSSGTDYFDYIISPLLRNLGQQLKSFHVESRCLPSELFEAIDNHGYTLQSIKLNRTNSPLFLEKLFHSNQIQYIQTLSLFHLADFEYLDLLKDLCVLKTLSLDFGSKYNRLVESLNKVPLFLNQLLKWCPRSLKELMIANTPIKIDDDADPVINPNQLTTLSFVEAKIEKNVTKFISATCSQLSSLSLIRCDTPVLEFDFANHDLKFFEIIGDYASSTFVLTKKETTLYYIMPNDDNNPIRSCCDKFITEDIRPFYSICMPVSYHQVNLKFNIHLICRSISTVFINGRLVS